MYKNFSFSISLFISNYFPIEMNQFQFNCGLWWLWVYLAPYCWCLFCLNIWLADIGQHWKNLTYFNFWNELCLLGPILKFKWSNEQNYFEMNLFCWINRLWYSHPSRFIYYLFCEHLSLNIRQILCSTLNIGLLWINSEKKGGF